MVVVVVVVIIIIILMSISISISNSNIAHYNYTTTKTTIPLQLHSPSSKPSDSCISCNFCSLVFIFKVEFIGSTDGGAQPDGGMILIIPVVVVVGVVECKCRYHCDH